MKSPRLQCLKDGTIDAMAHGSPPFERHSLGINRFVSRSTIKILLRFWGTP